MSKSIKYAILLIALAGLTLGACNTVKGAGRDVSDVGRGIEHTADDVQDDLKK